MLLTLLSTGKGRLSVCLPFNIILHINVVNKTEGFLQAWGSKLMLSYLPIVAEAYTTQPNSKASSRVLYMYFSCMAG